MDVGCGTGFPLIEIAERFGRGTEVFGIDPWQAAVARAQVKFQEYAVVGVSLHVGDAAEMPFKDGFFDLVVSNLGINNFPHREAVLAECHRVLAPSGTLALTTHLEGHMREFYEVFDSTLAALSLKELRPSLVAHIRHRSNLEEIQDLVARAGFRIIRTLEDSYTMRFADGSALFRHHFVRLAFLPAWRDLIPEESQKDFFNALETRLNDHARREGCLRLTIPMGYVEAGREPTLSTDT